MRAFAVSLLLVLVAAPVAAESKYDAARRQYPELFKVYYDAGVMEYCGLETEKSSEGFHLSRDALLASAPITDELHHDVRISAYMAVDYEYADRGLSGQRKWCATEGQDALDRFLTFYGAHHVATQ